MDSASAIRFLQDAATNSSALGEVERAQLLGACSQYVDLVAPVEKRLMDLLYAPLKAVAIRLAIDMGIFDAALAIDNESTVTLDMLSQRTSCEALLIKRIMRVLIDMKLFTEIDNNVFQASPSAMMYSTKSSMAQIMIHMTTHLQQIVKLPDYFADKGYQSPTDSMDCPFQYAMGTKLHNFDWIAANPKLQHALNVTMTIRTQRSVGEKWFKLYPIEQLVADPSSDAPFLVDVGGGIGHLTIELKKEYPQIGRCVVQDIEPVIKGITNLPDGIEAMTADFFKPQPIRGAKVYFIAHCLHDWPDKEARVIFGHIKDAMSKDSVLLLAETVMPERDVSFMAAAADLTMMAAFASLERTGKEFAELLDSAGLQLVKVWSENTKGVSMLGSSVVEARLKAVA